jgi:hypothetical protein
MSHIDFRLETIPLEIWTLNILPFIDNIDVLGLISQLSKHFNRIADSNEVWLLCAQRLDLEYFLVGNKKSGFQYKSLIIYHMVNNRKAAVEEKKKKKGLLDFYLV